MRDLQKPIKLYEHYKISYDKKTDEEQVDRKWRKRIVGGDIGLNERFSEDKKLSYESLSPGPGGGIILIIIFLSINRIKMVIWELN